jgi:hypothetical protein
LAAARRTVSHQRPTLAALILQKILNKLYDVFIYTTCHC